MSQQRRQGRPLERKLAPRPKPKAPKWPLEIGVCNVCHSVNSHTIICPGEFVVYKVAPVEEKTP